MKQPKHVAKLNQLLDKVAELPASHPVRKAMNEYLDARSEVLSGNYCTACGMANCRLD